MDVEPSLVEDAGSGEEGVEVMDSSGYKVMISEALVKCMHPSLEENEQC